ncbi:type I polyketide synthase [Streptomyces sp. CY1]|uniref:type I polyketide synthase n=1 Tax=Streptomyces sp. CY1 TaxID=3388313 RepID=UPI0039A27934
MSVAPSASAHASAPIAITGIACRLPGGRSPEEFWRLLSTGRHAVGETANGRWSAEQAVEHGGFLSDVAHFDAEFAGVTAAEAAAMDPQQRLALELAWEAMESARFVADPLRGSRSGVYLGVSSDDYAALVRARGAAEDRYTLTGTHRSMIANRVSHLLRLGGPSVTVDSGQSSSLVAVHLACDSIRRGEVDHAFVGGVNLNLAPVSARAVDALGVLSPDGRCYTFDERANGYVRGEGGVLIVLRPLTDALADGDRVHGVILGSAVNNDGAGQADLTTPDPSLQTDVLRAAYRAAGVQPGTVQYVELHGTGTRAGDPVEAAALGAALGSERPEGAPLRVGSVKTNIGHLEGAAGITGLLKVVLSLTHRRLPASLNFARPHPAIPLTELNLRVQTETTAWPEADRPLVAGVSSFGIGGTNCHVVLAEPPSVEPPSAEPTPPGESPAVTPWVLSARTRQALRGQAERLLDHFDHHDPHELSAADVGYSLATTRTLLEHRAVVFGREELAALKEQLPGPVLGTAGEPGRTVFVFPGQGSQWSGMGLALLAESAVFEARMRECARALSRFVDWDLFDVLCEPMTGDDVVQPATFAVMVSLAELWRSHGVRPDAVIGHSQGEIAAACVAGALSLEDAARVVVARSRAVEAIKDRGRMGMVALPMAEVEPLLPPGVTIGAVNGPRSVVVSGDTEPVRELLESLSARGAWVRTVPIDYASHSPHVDDIRPALLDELAAVRPARSAVPLFSTVTGDWMDGTGLDADYWCRNLRETVRFETGVRALEAEGFTGFIECSPHPALVMPVQETTGPQAVVVGSLRRDDGGLGRFLRSVAEAQVRGVEVDWRPAFPDGRPVDLPTYAFQRSRYWLDEPTHGPEPTHEPEATLEPEARTSRASRRTDEQRRAAALRLVREHGAVLLDRDDPESLAVTESFRDLGFDSLTSVELRNRLVAATGVALSSAVLYDHPTPAALAEHLAALLDGERPRAARTTVAAVATDDPIAVVAMSCRLPGAVTSPEDLWQMVAEERDAIGGFPTDRGWDLPDGSTATRAGGFLDGIDTFDAAFFGISPREATAMDPQQRLLLEGTWEALERAGIVPESLRATRTGVFVGASAQDYGPRLHETAHGAEGFLLTGTSASVLSGRVAYTLGLRGPAITVDTACSSSLVAVHLAVRSLQQGECSLALASGVTVMSTPGMFVEFSRQGGLSPDGRCKAFSAGADGTGWAEGLGVLVLERLSDARHNGHDVLAVIRGTAVNQDGASNGLTAPSGPAQEQVIREAMAQARLAPDDVDVVEAHGTGTVLGDPIEAHALLATYGQDRDHPLLLGSLKSNIGHTQAAAGIAGVIKMVQAMRHGLAPKTLHITDPTAHVDWSAGAVRLLTEAIPWPSRGRPPRAAVSSFGISGTNAHLVIEGVPAPGPDRTPDSGSTMPLLLTGHTRQAVVDQARRLAVALPGSGPDDVAFSLATTRQHRQHRAVVVGGDRDALLAGLGALEADDVCTASAGALAFLFTGQGSQRGGMAAELHARYPVFAQTFERVCTGFDEHLDAGLKAVVFEGSDRLDRTVYTQAALFAVEVSLFRLVESWGLRPDYLVGHSIGELAAAHVSGVLDLADAVTLVAARGKLMQALPGEGCMAAIAATEQEVLARLSEADGYAEIAAVNGPRAVVIAGDERAVTGQMGYWEQQGRRTRRLRVGHAFHTAHMEPMLADFHAVAEKLTFHAPAIPIVSNVTGTVASDEELCSPDYWVRHVRAAVRFGDGVRWLYDHGVTDFLELGPDAVLTTLGPECVDADARFVPALRRDRSEMATLTEAVSRLYAHGVGLDWAAVFDGTPARRTQLPTYPFQRRRYWLDQPPGAGSSPGAVGLRPAGHPLLGARIAQPDGDGVEFTGVLSTRTHSWLADHVVGGTVLVPATAFLEMAVHAGGVTGCPTVEELVMLAPLALRSHETVELRVIVGEMDAEGRRALSVHSRPVDGDAEWTRHATATLAPASATPQRAVGHWPPVSAVELSTHDLYSGLAQCGLEYGPRFQNVRRIWLAGDEVITEVELDLDLAGRAGEFTLHPALLDACLHGAGALGLFDGAKLPFSWQKMAVHATGVAAARVHTRRTGEDTVSLRITDTAGGPVADIEALSVRTAGPVVHDDPFLKAEWVPVTPASTPCRVAVVDDGDLSRCAGEYPDLVVVPVSSEVDQALPGAAHTTAGRVLELVRSWITDERFASARLVLVTRSAVGTRAGEEVPGLAQSPVWGLVRSAQREHPGRFVLLDLDADLEAARALLDVTPLDEPQLAVRAGTLLAPRLTRGRGPATLRGWNPDGTVLITGASGGLGRLIAHRLLTEHGMRHLVLAGRRPVDVAEFGPGVSWRSCDVADRDAVAGLLASIPAEHPLTAVVHAAGVLDDTVISGLTTERLASVLRPKVDGAWHLHELTRDHALDGFVLFSSASGILGAAGQANYAAGNTFLDALAQHRVAQGLPATSLAWAPWERTGMAAELSRTDLDRLADIGMPTLSTDDGLALFDAALRLDTPLLVAVGRKAGQPRSGSEDPGPLLRGLVPVAPGTRSERDASPLDLVRRELAGCLGQGPDEAIDLDRGFRELGVDSLIAVDLRNRLNRVTGLALSPTVVFDHPTPNRLAALIAQKTAPAEPPPVDEAALRRALATVPVARLRAAGLLDVLLTLVAEPSAQATPPADIDRPGGPEGPDGVGEPYGLDDLDGDELDGLDELDADDLVRLARRSLES